MATVLIGGGTGLVGSHLSHLLKSNGFTVRHLSRTQNLSAEFPAYAWDVKKMTIDPAAFEGVDYLINLAGAGIADQRWTAARKKLIVDSRVDSTLLLLKGAEAYGKPIKAFVSASAVGYYGDRGETLLSENDPAGPDEDFLAYSVKQWEQAIEVFGTTSDIRTVGIRVGVVLSTKGGALPKMTLPMKLGVASYFGDGKAWYSWIHIGDLARLFITALENESMHGFYNGVSPNPTRNKGLALALKEAMNATALAIPAPTFGLRLAMGEMADVVLDSTRVSSKKIEKTGFTFEYPTLVPALKDVIEREI